MISDERIMGFVEGEGCFSIGIGKNIQRRPTKGKWIANKKRPFLFQVHPSFRITLCEKDRKILEEIRETLGVGQIYVQKRSLIHPEKQDIAQYYTNSLKECFQIKEFFQRQKFYTRKGADFQIWCKALGLIQSGRHLEKEGLLELCRLRDQMNYRKTKNKRSTEEIETILRIKPIHNPAHFDAKQAKIIHNENFDLETWLKSKKGNNIAGRPEPAAMQEA